MRLLRCLIVASINSILTALLIWVTPDSWALGGFVAGAFSIGFGCGREWYKSPEGHP